MSIKCESISNEINILKSEINSIAIEKINYECRPFII
ncbi:UNVERIFIED_CONTAM: hypothetical protein Cloal_3248 [Acetivibrio alkalicellulosi]